MCIYDSEWRFDPSKLFNSDKTLVRASQHIMDNIKEGLDITATANDKNNKMRASLLTQEMESYMMTFYVQNLKLSTIYGFSKTVAENHSTLDILDEEDCVTLERTTEAKNHPRWSRLRGTMNFVMDKCLSF